ncbi:hypothetical protein KQX54_015274 [Cotesia glomerata]|uniref:Uncharacterized protein n=1 Tax=Cotesia glomerata TaxID=32391 RepID=A0AAV7IDP7_COTGL|nr:hypothetical protein KQX54_015274 [Cotesia glomerata]
MAFTSQPAMMFELYLWPAIIRFLQVALDSVLFGANILSYRHPQNVTQLFLKTNRFMRGKRNYSTRDKGQ